jgi:endogenous inhibitor of DNA gyrase (YacG/DUF329 family)
MTDDAIIVNFPYDRLFDKVQHRPLRALNQRCVACNKPGNVTEAASRETFCSQCAYSILQAWREGPKIDFT